MARRLLDEGRMDHVNRSTFWLAQVCMVLLVLTGNGRRGAQPLARSGVAAQGELDRDFLRISPTARYFTYTDGTPFFWFADSAWGLSGLSQDEIELFFADRRSKGFNVIQINVLIYLWAERGWNGGLPAFQKQQPRSQERGILGSDGLDRGPRESVWASHGPHARLGIRLPDPVRKRYGEGYPFWSMGRRTLPGPLQHHLDRHRGVPTKTTTERPGRLMTPWPRV